MQSQLFGSYINASSLLALIGFGLLYYALKINKKANVNFIRIGLLLVIQLIFLIVSEIKYSVNEDKRTRQRVLNIIANPTFNISIKGEELDSSIKNKFSADLKLIKDVQAHHSHPTDTLRIKLQSNKDTLILILGQDSMDSTEIWTEIWTDHNTRLNEIGRFYTRPIMYKTVYNNGSKR